MNFFVRLQKFAGTLFAQLAVITLGILKYIQGSVGREVERKKRIYEDIRRT